MRFKPAGHREMAYVVDHLSDLHRNELETAAAANKISVEQMLYMIGLWIDAHGAWAAFDDKGRVLCIYSESAASGKLLGTMSIWFFCSKWFFKETGKNLRMVRQAFDEWHAANPHRRYTTLTFTGHPKAEKWARLLGFNQVYEADGALRFTRV